MPDIVTTPPKPKSTRDGAADRDVLAVVDKWMALIREISGEQAKGQRPFRSG